MRRKSVSGEPRQEPTPIDPAKAWSWRWWWERVFDELEARDWFMVMGGFAFFLLIWAGKIDGDHLASIIAALAGYAFGRPHRKGDD